MDLNFSIIYNSRSDATGAGADRYFNGTICQRGHMSDRYTSTGNCVECHLLRIGKRQRMPTEPAEPGTIPDCLRGKATLAPCLKCSRFPNNCTGKTATTQLARATAAFPNHGHVTAQQAREASVTVYRPEEPCSKCGRVSWRTLGGKCGECDADERMPWRKWTPAQKLENDIRVSANIHDPKRIAAADKANED